MSLDLSEGFTLPDELSILDVIDDEPTSALFDSFLIDDTDLFDASQGDAGLFSCDV